MSLTGRQGTVVWGSGREIHYLGRGDLAAVHIVIEAGNIPPSIDDGTFTAVDVIENSICHGLGHSKAECGRNDQPPGIIPKMSNRAPGRNAAGWRAVLVVDVSRRQPSRWVRAAQALAD